MLSENRALFVKAYTCNEMGFCFFLLTSGLKKPTAHAHLNRSLGPYIEDMFRSFDRGIRFFAVYNKRET